MFWPELDAPTRIIPPTSLRCRARFDGKPVTGKPVSHSLSSFSKLNLALFQTISHRGVAVDTTTSLLGEWVSLTATAALIEHIKTSHPGRAFKAS
jgi:hypothetical protein